MPIREIIDNLRGVNEYAILEEVISLPNVRVFIVELNTEGQPTSQLYEFGIDSEGKTLGQYSPNTIEGVPGRFLGKKQKGQRFDHITLRDTGRFYSTFRVVVGRNAFIIFADGRKADTNLFDEFGEDIAGLTEQNIENLVEYIGPLVADEVEKQFEEAFDV